MKQSFCRNLFALPRCQDKRQKILKSRVVDEMTNQLDLRSFMKMYLDVRLLVKRTLTEDQRKLFAYQRDRLLMIEDEDSFDSDLDLDKDIRDPQAVQKFVEFLGEYKIETDLDRKLLLGVLIRDYHNKKMPLAGEDEMRLLDPPLDSFKSGSSDRTKLNSSGLANDSSLGDTMGGARSESI